MVVLLAATVFLGFSYTHYLEGVCRATLASRILHFEGAVFSSSMILLVVQATLLVVQTTLVSAGRADIHRRLRIAEIPGSGRAWNLTLSGVADLTTIPVTQL